MDHDTIKMIHHHPVENTGAKTKVLPYPLSVDSQNNVFSCRKMFSTYPSHTAFEPCLHCLHLTQA